MPACNKPDSRFRFTRLNWKDEPERRLAVLRGRRLEYFPLGGMRWGLVADSPCRGREASSCVLLILLLISGDLRLFQPLRNAEDNFKSSGPVENKRHTNAHQLSPPAQQQRIQSPLSARILYPPYFHKDPSCEKCGLLPGLIARAFLSHLDSYVACRRVSPCISSPPLQVRRPRCDLREPAFSAHFALCARLLTHLTGVAEGRLDGLNPAEPLGNGC